MKRPKLSADKRQQEVDKTLHSLDNWEPIKANPFFYTRLEQRIKNQQSERQNYIFNLWYIRALQPAFLFCLIIGSIYLGIWLGSNYTQQQTQITAIQSDDKLNTLAVEYLLGQSSSTYDYQYIEVSD